MRSTGPAILTLLCVISRTPAASALGETRLSLADALRAARSVAPDLLVARAQQWVARADVGVAGLYPNPSLSIASSTQTAKLSGTVSIPLVVLGQRGAAIDAARADEATVALDAEVAWNEVRHAIDRAYTALWLSEGVADARRESAAIEAAFEAAVVQSVEVGAAPEIDSLRVHAEKLRADADAWEASAQQAVAGSELGRWIGVADGSALRAWGAPAVPEQPPSLSALLARIEAGAPVRREVSSAHAADVRAARERALARPGFTLDLGFDAFDPTLTPPDATNYRAQLTLDVPLFHQRGAYVERERAIGDVARAKAGAARALATAELVGAYHTLEAATARQRVLADSVVPAARDAAKGMQEAYALGRTALVAVLDAQRVLVEARVAALEAQATRAMAWAAVEHSLGSP